MLGRRGHAWRYLPSNAPPAPGRGRCAPSSPTVGPSSELASAPNHPIRPTTAGAPPPRCRGRRGMPRSTPRPKPPRAPPREDAPPDPAHHPQLEVLLSGPPWQGAPPPSMLGRRGHASNYPPSKALPPPGPARRAPSTPPPGPRRARRPSHRANWRVPTIPKMPTVPRAKPPGPPRRRHAPSKVLSAGPHGL